MPKISPQGALICEHPRKNTKSKISGFSGPATLNSKPYSTNICILWRNESKLYLLSLYQ